MQLIFIFLYGRVYIKKILKQKKRFYFKMQYKIENKLFFTKQKYLNKIKQQALILIKLIVKSAHAFFIPICVRR